MAQSELTKAAEQIKRLTPEQIRGRLDELSAEERTLRVLLRAAIAAERHRPKPAKGASHA